ncbi:hypothetical protein AGMMS49579_00960 [Spirochaetia bacterium]|nr:hypothetical protein AGMMS49579_00960 [Spirochaetia bacterium]
MGSKLKNIIFNIIINNYITMMTLYNLSIRAIQDNVNNNLLDLKEIVKLLPIRLVKDLILTSNQLFLNKTFDNPLYDKIYSKLSKEEWYLICDYYFLPENFIIKWSHNVYMNLIRESYRYSPFHFSKKFHRKFPFFKKMIVCIECYKRISCLDLKFAYKTGFNDYFCKICKHNICMYCEEIDCECHYYEEDFFINDRGFSYRSDSYWN